jgi:hypothetical protein
MLHALFRIEGAIPATQVLDLDAFRDELELQMAARNGFVVDDQIGVLAGTDDAATVLQVVDPTALTQDADAHG